jgi:hypothetical protein
MSLRGRLMSLRGLKCPCAVEYVLARSRMALRGRGWPYAVKDVLARSTDVLARLRMSLRGRLMSLRGRGCPCAVEVFGSTAVSTVFGPPVVPPPFPQSPRSLVPPAVSAVFGATQWLRTTSSFTMFPSQNSVLPQRNCMHLNK